MMHKSWIAIVVAVVAAVAGSPPRAQAAHLVNGPNFPTGGIGCAMPNGLAPFSAGTEVFLDTSCQFYPNVDWAIGGGARIIASGLAANGQFACLDEASTTAGALAVVNPCAPRGSASQSWQIKRAPAPSPSMTLIVNMQSKLCLDTKQAGPNVIQLIVNTCSTAIGAGTGNWQIK
jgi:hypothetical protein